MRLITPDEIREEMQSLVRRAAQLTKPGENIKAGIRGASKLIGMSEGRIKRYWYGEVPSPPAHEVDAIRLAVRMATQQLVDARSPGIWPHSGIGFAAALQGSRTSDLHVVYDDMGEAWPVDSPDLRENLGYTKGDFDVGGFTVRCLGWLEVRHSPGRIHFRLSPPQMQPKTVDTLFRLIALAGKVDIELTVRDGEGWAVETMSSQTAALDRVTDLLRGPARPRKTRFMFDSRPMSVLFHDKHRRLISLVQESRDLLGKADVSTALQFANADESGRTSIAMSSPGKHGAKTDWAWLHIGSALRFYTPDERARLIGTDIRHAPDKDYGEWCAHGYDRAVEQGEAIVEDCRAIVMKADGDPIDTRYRRVMIPLQATEGRSLVLVSSDMRA